MLAPLVSPTVALRQENEDGHFLYGGRLLVLLFGAKRDWRLSHPGVIAHLSSVAAPFGVREILAPDPRQFNAAVIAGEDLRIDATHGIPPAVVPIRRGAEADGVIIPKRSAFYLASADCCVVTMFNYKERQVVCAHAGLRSLVDFERVRVGRPSRRRESIVHAMLDEYSSKQLQYVRVHISCGIGADHYGFPFDHPEHGEFNQRLITDVMHKSGLSVVVGNPVYGKISLQSVIREQCIRGGVRADHITSDTIDTYSERSKNGSFRWWSHRREQDGIISARGSTNAKGAVANTTRNGRNGVLVMHLW